MKYRKRPVEIEALQWNGDNLEEIKEFTKDYATFCGLTGDLIIETLEGSMIAKVSDYIIKGVNGEFYPCDSEIFRKTYYTNNESMGEVSDGYHTFNELYAHRTALFAAICNHMPQIAWKSKKHSDGTMFDGMFIAGINTCNGQITYHCDMKYWLIFRIKELDTAPEFDGHTSDDVLRRLETI